MIDELRFRSNAEKHEMSHLYEDKIKNMGNEDRNGGKYYTPRPLIKTIVKVVAPTQTVWFYQLNLDRMNKTNPLNEN